MAGGHSDVRSRPRSIEVSAPGRICVTGENLDWMGKRTLTAALSDVRLNVRASTCSTEQIVAHYAAPGLQVDEVIRRGSSYESISKSSRYVLACNAALDGLCSGAWGFNIAVTSDIPAAGGVASSAALCVATTAAIAAIRGLSLSAHDVARLAFDAERTHMRIPCGEMDQYAVAVGGLLLLDCSTSPPDLERLTSCDAFVVVVGYSAASMPFADVAGDLRSRLDRGEQSLLTYVRTSDEAASEVATAMRRTTWDMATVARSVARCQRSVQNDLGVVNTELTRWIDAALDEGASCAKTSGIRAHGGAMFALCARSRAQDVARRIAAEGGSVLVSEFDTAGLRYV